MWCSGMSLAGSSCSHFGSSLGSDGAQPLGVLSDALGKGAVSSWVRGQGDALWMWTWTQRQDLEQSVGSPFPGACSQEPRWAL